jgi:hypothetical protein
VGEEQAIGYFTDGCREETLLKYKLHRTKPKTMADFMAIADKYASADCEGAVPRAGAGRRPVSAGIWPGQTPQP